jgi:hypothetical protein
MPESTNQVDFTKQKFLSNIEYSAPTKQTTVTYKPAKLTLIPGTQQLQFGPYKLLHTLGEGEFGKVKLAELEGSTISPKFV